MNEQIVIKKINKGNPACFKSFFDDNFLVLCQFSRGFVKDVDVAKDIVQEAFISVWEKRKEFTDKTHLKSYLYKSIRNLSLNHLRDQKVLEKNKQEIAYLSSDKFYRDSLIKEEVYDFICKKIEQLPEMQRKVMELHIENLSNEEIAQRLRISVNTVRTHKQRAKSILKDNLKHLALLLLIYNMHC